MMCYLCLYHENSLPNSLSPMLSHPRGSSGRHVCRVPPQRAVSCRACSHSNYHIATTSEQFFQSTTGCQLPLIVLFLHHFVSASAAPEPGVTAVSLRDESLIFKVLSATEEFFHVNHTLPILFLTLTRAKQSENVS